MVSLLKLLALVVMGMTAVSANAALGPDAPTKRDLHGTWLLC